MTVPVSDRCAEDTERRIWTAEQADSGHDQGTDHHDARGRAEHSHYAASLTRRVSEDRTCLCADRVSGPPHVVRLCHEVSVGEQERMNRPTLITAAD